MFIMDKLYTLEEAKQYLRENFEKGADCPCCLQFVKLYKRRLNAGACRALILMYRIERASEDFNEWIHVQQEFASRFGLNANSMDYSQAQWWGLIESKPNEDDPTKKDSGFWRLTDLGRSFVRGTWTVYSHARLYNNKCLGFVGTKQDIKQALGKKFDYEELMNS